jgi:hypothetical protein
MTRTEELVGQLRRIAWGGYMHKKTTIQAADMIEEQAAEIERMRGVLAAGIEGKTND